MEAMMHTRSLVALLYLPLLLACGDDSSLSPGSGGSGTGGASSTGSTSSGTSSSGATSGSSGTSSSSSSSSGTGGSSGLDTPDFTPVAAANKKVAGVSP